MKNFRHLSVGKQDFCGGRKILNDPPPQVITLLGNQFCPWQKEFSLTQGRVSLFVLVKPSTDLM